MCDKCKTFSNNKYYCPEYGEYDDYFKHCPYCGEKLTIGESNKKYSKTYWDWIDTLEVFSDEWRAAVKVGESYCKAGRDLDDCLEEIKNIVKDMI